MTTILIKKKDTAGAPAAGDLTNAAGGAEIAVNTATKRIYTKDSGGNVVETGTTPSSMAVVGNFSVNTNKFTVDAATGNVVVAGTLQVAGGINLNGNVTVGDSSADTLTVNSTITSNLIFTDATYNIGASGANRPNNIYVANAINTGGTITASGSTQNFIAYAAGSGSYASIRLYNDQNSNVRSLEIDYSGSAYSGSVITGSPTGEQATIATTGAYPLTLGTSNTARMIFSGTATRVGIGRTPTSIFDVYGASPTMTIAASDNTSRSLYVATGLTSGAAAVTTVFGSLGDAPFGSLYTLTNHPLVFSTNNAQPQLSLTTGGKVAIGTSQQGYAGTPALYIAQATQDASSIVLNELNTSGGYNGSITWQGYYNGTTTTHDSMAIRRYNGVDDNTSAYRVYMDFLLRPPGVGQSLSSMFRMSNVNGGGLMIATNTNTYDNNLYVYKSVSNIVNGAQENNAIAAFGSTTNSGDAFVAIGADQGSNKYGYILACNRSLGYFPLLINPVGGFVGIGTGVSMPAYNLDVWSTSPTIRVKATSSAGGAQLILDAGTTSGYSNQIGFAVNGSTVWAMGGKDIGFAGGNQFSLYNYNTGSNAFTIQNSTNLTSINSASPEAMLYVNTAGYAMTSGQTGAFLLVSGTGSGRPCIQVASTASGQDTSYRTISTNGSTWSGWTVGMNIETGSDTLSWCYASGQANRIFSNSGGVLMRLTTAGSSYNNTGTWGTISDARLKENIVDATPKLANIMALRVRNYNMIADEAKKKMLGLVAQEVEQIFPGLVEEIEVRDRETKEVIGTEKTVKMSIFIPMLVKAMQELKTEFDAYKASHP